MEDVLGYRDASVVVTGAASGMGAATAQVLVDLGAQVTAIDIKPTEVAVSRFIEVDLRDRAAIDDAVASIGDPVNNLFSCAGLPGPPFSELDTMLVNFVGARHLAEGLVPKMPRGSSISAISSSAAVGWQDQMATIGQLLATDGFDAAVEWLTAHEESWSWSGYLFSKWVVDAWVGWWYPDLAATGHPNQLHQPGPDRHGDDAGVPRLRHQGGRRPGGRADRTLRACRRAGVATRRARQSAIELRRRRGVRRRRRLPGRAVHRPSPGRMGRHDHRRLTANQQTRTPDSRRCLGSACAAKRWDSVQPSSRSSATTCRCSATRNRTRGGEW